MRPSMLGVKDHNGPASVKTECCGNPLRGCINCPPEPPLTFDQWYSLWVRNLPAHRGFVNKEDMKAAWLAAKRGTL